MTVISDHVISVFFSQRHANSYVFIAYSKCWLQVMQGSSIMYKRIVHFVVKYQWI